jgi:uncharacterized protein
VINRLKILYELQMIDNQLDELAELRGDLPNAVEELRAKLEQNSIEIKEKQKEKEESVEKRIQNEEELEKLQNNQKKFKAQLYQVRNNKEYDALTKEIDHTDELIKHLEEENEFLENKEAKLSIEVEDIKPHIEELSNELKVKEADLKEIIKANENEEKSLQEKRQNIADQIKKPDYSAYMRIRKAKRGKAVASIKRSACSGCHNIVPSQRQLEIRRNNRLFFCEYCGRILVSSEVAETVTEHY